MDKPLLCVAHKRQNQWEAICLDFDLAVQGQTFEEVQDMLNQAIASYVDDAMAEDEPAQSELLSRRAPLLARVAWVWPLVIYGIFDRSRDGDSSIGFSVPCPA